MPKGGRHNSDLVLREDQLPKKHRTKEVAVHARHCSLCVVFRSQDLDGMCPAAQGYAEWFCGRPI